MAVLYHYQKAWTTTVVFYFVILLCALLVSKGHSQSTTNQVHSRFHELNTSLLLDLFNQYPIVAVGEGQHNSALTFEWLTSLIHENAFPDVIRNIVVEFGTSEYQSVMDDFVNNRDVPDSLFKKCWRETTQIMVWDNPVYEHFFREIRKINIDLPTEKRIRVLLGDPSWGSMEIHDEHAFHIIEEEVLKKGQTALLIFGDLHFVRRDVYTNYSDPVDTKKEFLNVIQFLELHYPGKAFSLWGSVNTNDTLTHVILAEENIQVPDLIYTSNSKLGDIDFRVFYPYPTQYRTDHLGNDIEEVEHVQMPMKKIVDGIIYRGSWEEQNFLASRPDHIYEDTAYLNELIKREQILQIPPYRTRLYFYKIFESKEFTPFLNALESDDISSTLALYQPLKIQIPEDKRLDVLNFTGFFYLRKNELLKAISIFRLAVHEYPHEFYTYYSLGDAYSANSEITKAITAYENALRINPDHKPSRDKMDQLKNK